MFFKLFTNKIYIVTQISHWTIALLSIYINWREYKFIGNIKQRPPAIRKYMSSHTFHSLRRFNETKLFIEIVSDSVTLLIQIVFSDELSHLSLWNLSTRIAGSSSESMVTLVFIAVTTCKDFLFVLPVRIYSEVTLSKVSLADTIEWMFVEFCIEIVSQIVLLSGFVYIYNLVPNVSKNAMIYAIIGLLIGMGVLVELSFESFLDNYLIPLEDPLITKELQPFLQKMDFPEDRIYLLVMPKRTDLPNAFTLGSRFFKNERIIVSDNIIGKYEH